MRLIANEYSPKDIFRITREWTNLTQEEIGKLLGKKGRSWAKFIENGKNRFYFEDFLEILKKNNIKMILEKDK